MLRDWIKSRIKPFKESCTLRSYGWSSSDRTDHEQSDNDQHETASPARLRGGCTSSVDKASPLLH